MMRLDPGMAEALREPRSPDSREVPSQRIVLAAVAVAAAVLAAPTAASAGMGLCFTTSTPSVTIQVSPSSPVAGDPATLTCTANANGGTVNAVTVTVSDGNLDSAGATTLLTEQVTGPSAQLTWLAPASPGAYTVRCDAVVGACTNPASTGPVNVTVGAVTAAPVVSGVSGPVNVVVNGTAALSVTASDPAGLPLTYAWTATCGTFPASATGPSATWQAPAGAGSCDVTAAVSNGAASTASTKTVNVALALFQATLPVPVDAPRRLAASQDGFAATYVIDRQLDLGRVTFLNVRGEVRGSIAIPEPAVAVAQGGGFLWVTTAPGNVFKLDSGSGRIAGKLAFAGAGRALLRPFGIAYEPSRMTLWIAELDAGRVRIVRPDGTPVAAITTAGGGALGGPVDVAVDEAGGKVWVLDQEANAAGNFLHAYDLDGHWLGSYVTTATVSRGGGVGVGPDGKVYVTDAFQGVVQVFDRTGASVGMIGAFGEQVGQLIAPAGVAVLVNGDVAVATPTNGQVVRYGSGAALPPTCTVHGQLDSDCDGLSDAWELAHGLNPHWAGDAFAAFGRTGLTNYEVATYQAQYGTDPWAPPTVAVSGQDRSNPGLVKMFATPSGPPNYAVSTTWRQVAGPVVSLRDASTIAPSFVARTAGVYTFEVVGSTSLATGAATRTSVTVNNVPPVADPGRLVVTEPGGRVRLDGSFSSDANGDALSYAWDQSLGAPLATSSKGAALSVLPRVPGLYTFLLTATDAGGLSAGVEVPVLVQAEPTSTAIAAAAPASAQVGQPVSLDGTGSLFADAAPTFFWEQIDGPPAAILGSSQPVASVVPGQAGRYAFALTVFTRGGRRSPPARVDVFVAEVGGTPPVIQSASADRAVVEVNTPVALGATGTGTGYAWSQVTGPAAGLTGADTGSAAAVPFSPGWYVFEVSATDGAAVGPPARVSFEARSNGRPIPIARLSSPTASPMAGQMVILDARSSTDAARFRVTQVAGPWVVLSGEGAVRTFRAHDPGTYAFELEVDDGRVRSAPARLELTVTDHGGN
jgi:hypothetical protein